MGTGTSSKTTQEDVRNRLNSGDFQKVSPPSSPSMTIDASPTDENEMSYSGILVENPGVSGSTSGSTLTSTSGSTSSASAAATATATATATTMSASFAADLSTPPISNKSKSRAMNTKAAAAAAAEQPRRIVKATPPSKVSDADGSGNGNGNGKDTNKDAESPAVHHQSPSLASPIGANAATEMLEESIEKNDSKNKRMERVTNKQKSDRDKLLQEKRRQNTGGGSRSGSDNKKVQANPFSRFLSAFSVDTNPTHKRKESNDAGDPTNKRLKFGFPASADSGAEGEHDPTDPSSSITASSKDGDGDKEDDDNTLSFFQSPWFAAASAAAVAVLVFAIVRGSKKK